MAKITYNNPQKDKLNNQLSKTKSELQTLYNAFSKVLARDGDTDLIKQDIADKLEEIRGLNDELQAL